MNSVKNNAVKFKVSQAIIKVGSLLMVLCSFSAAAQRTAGVDERNVFSYGGYIKMDMLLSWYNNGKVASTSPMRDFMFPSAIPIGELDKNQYLDFHVKESRFNFDLATTVKGQNIHGFLELDFLLSSQGNEKVSNSFNPRIRHFYFEWNRFLIGQSWSTFMVVVIPDDLDFTGALEGLAFIRQPQIRYRLGSWWFSIENPTTLLSPYQESQLLISEKESLPDFVVRKNFSGKWGNWALSGIYRTLSGVDSLGSSEKAVGYGITTGGKIWIGNGGDDLRMVATYGNGLGRYLAGGFISSGVYDENYNIQTHQSVNGYVAYNHFWVQKKLSSSFNVGYFLAGYNNNNVGSKLNKESMSASVNIKYDPMPNLRFGIEYIYAQRKLVDDTDGEMVRLQVSAKYKFGYTNSSATEK